MKGGGVKVSHVVPGSILAVVVLITFTILRSFGPESTIRLFHQAVITSNLQEVSELTEEKNPNDPAVMLLAQRVSYLTDRLGARYTIRRSYRDPVEPGRVYAAVEYRLDGAPPVAMVYVVDRSPGKSGWVVNSRLTQRANAFASGL